MKKLLLHACCAPCASVALERLAESYQITAYYFNPNITDEEEYEKRAAELLRLAEELTAPHPIETLIAPYAPASFLAAASGLEDQPEGGARCGVCFELRLSESVRYAKEHGFDLVTTSLTLSPLKNAALLNEIGEREARQAGLTWLHSDFKKQNGVLRSGELCRIYGLYRQNYCGCDFSKRRDYGKLNA